MEERCHSHVSLDHVTPCRSIVPSFACNLQRQCSPIPASSSPTYPPLSSPPVQCAMPEDATSLLSMTPPSPSCFHRAAHSSGDSCLSNDGSYSVSTSGETLLQQTVSCSSLSSAASSPFDSPAVSIRAVSSNSDTDCGPSLWQGVAASPSSFPRPESRGGVGDCRLSCGEDSGDGSGGVWSSSCHSDSGVCVTGTTTSNSSTSSNNNRETDTDADDNGGSIVLMDLPELLLSADDSTRSWFCQQQQERVNASFVPLVNSCVGNVIGHGLAIDVPDAEGELSQSSTFSEEILYKQDLTLDKATIARDLLGECDAAGKSPRDSACCTGQLSASFSTLHRSALISAATAAAAADSVADYQQSVRADNISAATTAAIPAASSQYAVVPIGSEHQASVSPLKTSSGRELESASAADTLLWSCHALPESTVTWYLDQWSRKRRKRRKRWQSDGGGGDAASGSARNELAINRPDCEHALEALQCCGHDVSLALLQQQQNQQAQVEIRDSENTGEELGEEDVFSFEAGLRLFGKNFARIRRFKLPERSVGELVRYYYRWKKKRPHRYAAILPKFVDKRKHILRRTTMESSEPSQSAMHHSTTNGHCPEPVPPPGSSSALVSSVRLVVKRATSCPSGQTVNTDCIGSNWTHATNTDEITCSSIVHPSVFS